MPTVNAPTSPVITQPAAQPAPPADATGAAGATRDGRRVSPGATQGPIAPAVAGATPAPSAGPVRTVEAAPGEAVNRAGELRRPDLPRASLLQRLARYIREGVDKLLARFKQRNSQDARASAPAAPDALPKNFNVDEFVARIDQELAMQDEEIRSHERRLEADPALGRDQAAAGLLKRMSAERDARSLARAEALAGRNPLPALYAQAGKLDAAGDRAGAAAYTGWAAQAFTDTAEYLAGSGNEFFRNVRPERVESLADLDIADVEDVELMILNGKTPRNVDFRGLSRQWRAAADRFGAQTGQYPRRTPVEIERADDRAAAEGYMLQAIDWVNQGRDPRPVLLQHAQDLESRQYEDGVRLAGEPRELRAMAAQYDAVLEKTLGSRAGADWLDQVRSLHEAARQES